MSLCIFIKMHLGHAAWHANHDKVRDIGKYYTTDNVKLYERIMHFPNVLGDGLPAV